MSGGFLRLKFFEEFAGALDERARDVELPPCARYAAPQVGKQVLAFSDGMSSLTQCWVERFVGRGAVVHGSSKTLWKRLQSGAGSFDSVQVRAAADGASARRAGG